MRIRTRSPFRVSRGLAIGLAVVLSQSAWGTGLAASRPVPSGPRALRASSDAKAKPGSPAHHPTATPKPHTPAVTPATGFATALGPSALPGARVSAVLLGVQNGLRTIASVNPGMRLSPGRLEGILTMATALWHLGPSTRVATQILAPAPRHGVILGNIVIRGSGDITLSGRTLASMAAHISHRVREVTGEVLADASLFSFPVTPPGWPYGLVASDPEPGAAALSVDQDRVTVWITPAKTAGSPATVAVKPAGALGVSGTVATLAAPTSPPSTGTQGQAKTAAGVKRGSKGATTGSSSSSSTTPAPGSIQGVASPKSLVPPSVLLSPTGTEALVSGTIAVGAEPVSVTLDPPTPAREAASILRHDLVADHVHVEGGVGTGLPIPLAVALASAASPPLSTWVTTVLGTDGGTGAVPAPLSAETVERLLCRPSAKDPCGAPTATKLVESFLTRIGAPSGSIITDGSGLSVQDEVASQTLARTLGVGLLHDWGAPLVHGMAPLPSSWSGLPPQTLGWVFTNATAGQADILALVPYTETTSRGSRSETAVYAALVTDPGAALSTLEHTLAHAATVGLGLSNVSPSDGAADGTGSPRAAATNTVPAADTGLLHALNASGPGTSVAATLWPVGAAGPQFDWNGATLEPAPGAPALLLGETALSQARTPATTPTRAVVDGTLEGRILYGSIGLIGASDPTLSESALTALAHEIASLGVRSVTGGVTADDAVLPLTLDADWPWQVAAKIPYLPQDALMSPQLDLFSIAVLPASHAGQLPQATLVPSGLPARVDNEAVTVAGTGSDLHLWPIPGQNRFVLSGTIGRRDHLGVVFLRVFPNPALATAQLFRDALVAAGIHVGTAVKLSPVPPQAPLLAAVPAASPSALLSAMVAAPNPAITADVAQRLGGLPQGLAMASLEARAAVWGHGPAPQLNSLFGLGGDADLTSSDMAHALALFQPGGGVQDVPSSASGIAGLAALMPSLATHVRGVVVASPSLGEVALYGFLTVPRHAPIAFTAFASGLSRPSQAFTLAVIQSLARLARG